MASPSKCIMEKQLTLCCSHGSEIALKKVSGSSCYDEVAHFISMRWTNLNSEMVSISYTLPGYHSHMLDSDEELVNLMEMAQWLGVDCVDVVVSMNAESSLDGLSGGSDEYDDVCVDNRDQVSVEMDLLPSFYSHEGSLLMGSGWSQEIRGVGQEFQGGAVQFRTALIKYAIEVGFHFKYVKNDSERVTAECSYRKEKGCAWRVHASKEPVNKFFYIKKMNNTHTCRHVVRTSKHPRVTSDLVRSLVIDKIRRRPLTSPMDVIDDIKKNYGLDIEYHHAWLGVENTRKEIFGDHELSFDKLRWYIREAVRVNPGSHLFVDLQPETQRFERCFVAFGACLNGFNFVRPMVFLDGTFLKGRHKGVLLAASCKDGNQGIISLAFAIVRSEDTDNWVWFLRELRRVVGENCKITFISDRHPGLIKGVRTVFEGHYHGFCMFHLKLNLQDKLRGLNPKLRERLLYKFRQCAYAPNAEQFAIKLDELLLEGGQRVKIFISDLPHQNWCNSYFRGQRYGEMCSNVTESWNKKIREARHLPITNLIDKIRIQIMTDMAERRRASSEWSGILCPAMQKRLQLALDEGATWNINVSDANLFEVHCHPSVFVNTTLRLCSCGGWQSNGFPCAHAAAVISKSALVTGKTLTDFVEPYFHAVYYRQSYAKAIHPVVTFDRPVNSSPDGFCNNLHFH